ncbi:V-type ATP synthase subunit D [Ruminococcaceae bacterium OttesenSCG-928-I18]|nr:V-type ATP synthase subunit D [Ruminococcaceae bacterium OttesenSCG-928-I18]
MAEQVSPTKANLLAIKKNLALAKTGFDLLDRKRNVLMREMMKMIDQAAALQRDIGDTFSRAYAALQMANVTLGIDSTMENYTEEETGFSMTTRSVMGIELPTTQLDEKPPFPFYGFKTTNSYLDTTYILFNRVKELAARLAGVENSVYRLAMAIKKTQRRANMLENVVIPRYEESVRFISSVLEEHEREEFTRMKVIKSSKAKKKKQQEMQKASSQ